MAGDQVVERLVRIVQSVGHMRMDLAVPVALLEQRHRLEEAHHSAGRTVHVGESTKSPGVGQAGGGTNETGGRADGRSAEPDRLTVRPVRRPGIEPGTY